MRFGQWHDIEVEDDVTALMEYEDGHTGVFITSTGDPHGSNRFEVQMDGAQLIAENNKLYLLEFDQLEQEWTKTNKSPSATFPPRRSKWKPTARTPARGRAEAWAAAILRGEPLVAGGEEGINGLTLSNAMHLSAFLGKPVELPIDEDLYYDELMKRVATSRRKAAAQAVFGRYQQHLRRRKNNGAVPVLRRSAFNFSGRTLAWKRFRTAVIGIGNMGSAHAKCIRGPDLPADARRRVRSLTRTAWPGAGQASRVLTLSDWQELLASGRWTR